MDTPDRDRSTATDVEVLIAEAKSLYPDEIDRLQQIEAVREEAERRQHLRTFMHARTGDARPTALCLSGGGIRSATFSLGVVQGLASRHLLAKFHYLSSVSGGGYLASWLSAWIRNEGARRQREADRKSDLAAAAGTNRKVRQQVDLDVFNGAQAHVFDQLSHAEAGQPEEPLPLRKLRAYSNYLSPMRGISADALTLLAIYARNLVLNWVVLIPALSALLLLPRIHMAVLHRSLSPPGVATFLALLSVALIAWTVAYMASDLPAAPGSEEPVGERLKEHSPLRPHKVLLPLVLPLASAAIVISWLVAWHARGLDPLPWMRHAFAPAGEIWLLWLLRCIRWPDAMSFMTASAVHGLLLAAAGGAVVQLAGSVLGGTVLRRLRDIESGSRPASAAAALAVTVSGALTGAGLYLLIHGLISMSSGTGREDLRLLGLLGVPLLLLLFWLGVTLYAGWRRPLGHEDEREWWARAAARWLAFALGWLLAFGLVLYLPGALLSWSGLRGGEETAALGLGTGALGIVVAVVGYLSKHGPAWRKRVETIAEKTGMRLLDLAAIIFIVLFLAGLSFGVTLVMGTHAELRERQEHPPRRACTYPPCVHWTDVGIHRYERSLTTVPPLPLVFALGGLLTVSLLLSHRLGVNAFSLHSLYGNRLVRAYLAASRFYEERRPHWFTGFDPKDNIPMNELWPRPGVGAAPPAVGHEGAQPHPPRLLHVVNMALNLVQPSGKRLEWQDRKAAPFTVSPLFSGSTVTNYVRSSAYIESPHRQGISLGAAMTISGAAASPNMGCHSSMPLAFVMTLFNVRLGMWMPNPKWPELSGEIDRWPWRRDEPTLGLGALMSEALGLTSAESRFLNLSDGGHFDNMALYEMVRRRCGRIVLIDAVEDPDYTYDELLGTLRKIRVDMGIVIEFPEGLPGPQDKKRSGRAVATGHIRYATADRDAQDGTIVLIKPLLEPEERKAAADPSTQKRLLLPLDVRRYAEESARGKVRFPQQPTSDQFFDEAQFESYRMLGLHIAATAFEDGSLDPAIPPATPTAPVPVLMPSAESAPAPAATPEKDSSSLLDQMRDSMGLVAATAVVSAITVTGVVKLADTNVRISNPELRLASEPMQAPSIDVSALQGSVQKAASAADALTVEAARLAAHAASAAGGVVTVGQRANEAASAVADFRERLKGSLPGPGGPITVKLDPSYAKALSEAASNVKRAADGSEAAAGASRSAASDASQAASAAASAVAGMNAAAGKLEEIRKLIEQMPPRPNARGGNKESP